MAVTINASTSAGLVQTADTTGNLSLQSNGTTIAALTSTGLAVTGAGSFSTTLGVTGASTIAALSATSGTFSTTLAITGVTTIGDRTAFGSLILDSGNPASSTLFLPKIGFRANNVTIGLVGASGAVLGTTATDMVIFAETGKTINLWPNGGVTGTIVSSTGLAVTGTLGAGVTTISGAGTAQALNVDATSGAYAVFKTAGVDSGYIGLGVFGSGATAGSFGLRSVNDMQFAVGSSAVDMTISSAGAVTITGTLTVSTSVTATQNLDYGTSSMGFSNYNGAGTASSSAVSNWQLRADSATGRSIAAGGTINASGADYAEYEPNDGLLISKGSIVGFKANGALTLTFAEATRFGVKSTNPSYVGGDSWGGEDAVGARPTKTEDQTDEEFAVILASFETVLEAARVGVDRIAYSGKVPCNIVGATPGDYIIAADDSGVIGGVIVTTPTFEQYKNAVGRVNKILPDGRAELAVIIH